MTLRRFNDAIEATDVLIHRRRISALNDMQAAVVGASDVKQFKLYISQLNRARKDGR